MRIKSYFACTVEDAVDAARQELGADAMLVHSRRTPPESSRLGEYEVVFGLHAPPAEAEPGPSGAPAAMAWPAGERLSTEGAELKKELEGMRRALTRSSYGASLRPVALAPAIEENRGKDPIFIDTPGLGFGDMDHSPGLARFLTTRSDIDTHLVLPASMKSADLARSVDCFEAFGPQRLLFSKLDETGSFGPLFGEAARGSKPLSFFTTGQRIPEDIEAASGTRLIELVLAGQGARAQSAA